jgi:uncharacterized protein (TIGR00730 family)
MMNRVAEACLEAGGEVIGVIPRFLLDREVGHGGLTRLEVVDTMHQRKARMAELADAIVALPGGLGTLEELFELWTAGLLGLHSMPLGLLDTLGFYRPLLGFLEHLVVEDFVTREQFDRLRVESDPHRLLDRLAEAAPPLAAPTRAERF